ncbi:Copia protein [Trachymyrmex cornetzi]|uniref:Copia protein n=1 Tax=Trachymyrmex cornetzi TaxID=471704 RepID=A0A151IX06_9HYME|nr:Copia protein [Trachymyrmex cornetzi]
MIRNRVPLDRLDGITPWEAFTNEQPDVSFLRIYGSEAYAHVEDQFRNKFDKKSKKMVLVKYEPGSRAYRLWEHGTKNVYTRCNVKIVESRPLATVQFIDDNEETKLPKEERENKLWIPTLDQSMMKIRKLYTNLDQIGGHQNLNQYFKIA